MYFLIGEADEETSKPSAYIGEAEGCYQPGARHGREETERFRAFDYGALASRDKTNLDIFWLKDDSLEDTENLPAPDVLAAAIVENLGAALEQFRGIQEELEGNNRERVSS